METYQSQSVPPSYNESVAPSYQQQPYSQPIVYAETTTVAVTSPLLVANVWSEIPQRHRCQFCSHDIVTEVVYEPGTMTWLVAGGLLLVGCWLGCCLIPFCTNSFKDPVHICPHCHNVVGKKSRV